MGTSDEVTVKLQQSNAEAETSVLQEEQRLLEQEQIILQREKERLLAHVPPLKDIVLTPMVFLQAIALHCRDPEFKAKVSRSRPYI